LVATLLGALVLGLMNKFREKKGSAIVVTNTSWQWIGNNKSTSGIPRWVLSAFGREPGSHGTLLIDYPIPEVGPLYFRGKTFLYRIDMGNQSWDVYRRRHYGRKVIY